MAGNKNKYSGDILKRDLLRDFSLAVAGLEEQFVRFDQSGNLSFSIISEVVGSEVNKGLLWRTKDAAHHLFDEQNPLAAGNRLDWCIGFLFHESLQMLEAAYQLQHYGPKLDLLVRALDEQNERETPEKQLLLLARKSRNGLKAHISRVRRLVALACDFFCSYLAGQAENPPLARLIYERQDLLSRVFGPLYPRLLEEIYGPARETVFVESAFSLAEAGRQAEAKEAARKALAMRPDCQKNAELQQILNDNYSRGREGTFLTPAPGATH